MAFRSAYFMVKNLKSKYLYYVNSEFSVLFLQNSDKKLDAYVSSSTIGLRKALTEDGKIIEFMFTFRLGFYN